MATAATYEQRKAITADTGTCIQAGCDDPAASGSMQCVPHRESALQARREYQARIRKYRRRHKLCVDCGTKLRGTETTWCTRHRIARRRDSALRRQLAGVQNGVEKSERIAQRTITHEDGRTRYHGQDRRGQQTHAQLDEQDIGFARREITRGETGLAAYTAEAQRAKEKHPEALPKVQRDGIRSDALGYLERAQRHLDDVLERHRGGHAMKRHGRRDGDEE